MKKLSKRTSRWILIIATLLLLIMFVIWQNDSIVISSTDFYNNKVTADFEEFKIVQISDLHNKKFGSDQSKLLSKVESLSPDIIVITGDLIDRRKYDLITAMSFIEGSVKIAPTYFVSGNHESWSGEYSKIKNLLMAAGVSIMDDTALEISKGDSSIKILGLSDPDFLTNDYSEGTDTSKMVEQLKQWEYGDEFRILLSHRPELFDLYCKYNIDLIFTGHAHGGQFRLPFIGGLFSPDQGLFPDFTEGSYTKETSTMFVSRGLGNSIFPIRIFNRPEIVEVTLKAVE